MEIKNIIVAAVVALAVTVVGLVAFSPGKEIVQVPQIGALSGPDIMSPYLRWGGVPIFAASQKPTAATYNFCALQSPAATSSLIMGGVRLSVSTSTAGSIFFAKATTATASTTQIGTDNAIAANSQVMLIASTTVGSAAQTEVFAPNTYFIVGYKGEAAAGISNLAPQGVCQARWQTFSDL